MASALGGSPNAVYVWEAPVRAWHWLMALCMVVLSVTGYLIASPPPSVLGEASENFLMGYIRFVHFSAGYIFAAIFVLRVYWAFVGNKYSRGLFALPVKILQPGWWKGLIDLVTYYTFVGDKRYVYLGHNPMAMAAMFLMFLLGSIFMILSGLALYGEGAGMASWQFRWFTSWLQPLIGDSQALHTWHHFGMWYLIIFAIIHVYLVIREDIFLHETVISTMINGWRVPKP